MELARAAQSAGLKHGVIQDKLFLPGFAKLLFVRNSGFFRRILSIRIDAGSWIFDGKTQECQRPSWNYKRAEGGGIALDMMAHWQYMIDRLVAPITGVCALLATAIPERVDEQGRTYPVDVEDTSHALLQMSGGAVGVITNSWAVRIRHDDTMVAQIDGTLGSAVAGRFRCFTQAAVRHARGVLRRGTAGRHGFRGAVAGGARYAASHQSVPAVLGGIPKARCRGCAVCSNSRGRRQGRAARRSCLSQRRRASVDACAGTSLVGGFRVGVVRAMLARWRWPRDGSCK